MVLEGVRGAIPLALKQIDVMLRVIEKTQPNVNTFLDLGCGDGILGRAIHLTFVDTIKRRTVRGIKGMASSKISLQTLKAIALSTASSALTVIQPPWNVPFKKFLPINKI
jgi:hypothetical protein